jgi:hypothetical protein
MLLAPLEINIKNFIKIKIIMKNLGVISHYIIICFVGCEDVEYVNLVKSVVVTLIHSPSEHNTELTETAYVNNVQCIQGLSGNRL